MEKARQTVKHYHADNGRFSDNGFINAINQKDQKISFCGVGTHHQNGIIENNDKILTTGARMLLIHGIRIWLQMIDEMFWPSALKAISDRLNILQIHHKRRTPEYILHVVNVKDIPVKLFHILLIRIYMLDSRLQNSGGSGPPKWEPRSCIGVYLEHLPFYSGYVKLVWNTTTGHISPQYHIVTVYRVSINC